MKVEKIRISDMPELGDCKEDYINNFNEIEAENETGITAIDVSIESHYIDQMHNPLVDCIFTIKRPEVTE